MTFLTFLLYFVISHLVYTVLATVIAIGIQKYRYNKQKNSIEQLLKSGQIKMVQLDSSEDDGQWH